MKKKGTAAGVGPAPGMESLMGGGGGVPPDAPGMESLVAPAAPKRKAKPKPKRGGKKGY